MSGLTGRPALRRLGGATLCALLGLLWAAGPVAAQSVVFGTPSATSKFGQSIDFSQPYAGATVASADILIEEPGDVGPTELPLTSIGTTTLAYSLDTSGGALYPNTPVVAHFEVTLADGTIQDGPAIDITYVDDRYAWKTLVGKYVRLHWFQSSNSFAQQMLTWADDGVQKAAAFFGVTESQPIDFFVYPSESAFQQGLSQAETIGGVALSNIRTCFAAVAPGDSAYGQTVLPHEVTHIVFADASDNPYHSPPRWLNEGLAVYLSQGYDASDRQLVSQAAGNGTLRSLFAFADYFPLDASRIYLAYAESVSAVDFMVRKYGQPAVAKLVKAYANGVTDDQAFVAGIGIDVAAFNSAWLASNGVKPTEYGPQPAPTGPLPPGWSGSGSGSGPGATPQPTAGPGVATTPVPTSVPVAPLPGRTEDQTAYGVAGAVALLGLLLLGLAGWLAMRPGGRAAG